MSDAMQSLDEIGVVGSTDKSSICHGYLAHYERVMYKLRNEPITLLEIGVYNGASLRTWRKYLAGHESSGLIIDPACLVHARDGMEVLIGS